MSCPATAKSHSIKYSSQSCVVKTTLNNFKQPIETKYSASHSSLENQETYLNEIKVKTSRDRGQ